MHAKLLAARLQSVIPSIISLDQVGFTSTREARYNTIKILPLISHCQSRKVPLWLLISVDAKRHLIVYIEYSWNQHLSKLIYPWIWSINGLISDRVHISNGTHQGCPLLPLLFILAMEHLAMAIRANNSIHGVYITDKQNKITLFADNPLLHITIPLIAFPSLLKELELFGTLSNFKINATKSYCLDISLPVGTQDSLADKIPFQWAQHSIEYLGVGIPSQLQKLYKLTYCPLLSTMQQCCKRWSPKRHSWLGWMSIFMMNILPRFLYNFQTIQIRVPHSFFCSSRSILLKYILPRSIARLKYDILVKRRDIGGAGLPHLELYHTDSQALEIPRNG